MDDTELGRALTRAGIGPRDLIRAVNKILTAAGHRRLSETAAYPWAEHGWLPRDKHVPAVVASVLSTATGHRYSPADLWPGRSTDTTVSVTADDGLTGPWDVDTVLDDLHRLCSAPGPRRRTIAAITGIDLLTAARTGVEHTPRPLSGLPRGEKVLPPTMTIIENHIADLRRLDDLTGGGTISQRYVTGQLAIALDLLGHAHCERAVATRLLHATADLARIAGWMHYDAHAHGTAQRYLLLALRLARAGNDTAAQANILGMLAYQAAHTDSPAAAVELAEAAVAAAHRHPPAVRARAHGRLATAHAAAGNLDAYRHAAERSRTLLEHGSGAPGDALYYFGPRQLDAETGQALVTLAHHHRARPELLKEATVHLRSLAEAPSDTPFQRSALLHGCYLAEAHLRTGNLEPAARTIHTALDRLPHVQSTRCRSRLAALRAPLIRRRRDHDAAQALERLDHALASR